MYIHSILFHTVLLPYFPHNPHSIIIQLSLYSCSTYTWTPHTLHIYHIWPLHHSYPLSTSFLSTLCIRSIWDQHEPPHTSTCPQHYSTMIPTTSPPQLYLICIWTHIHFHYNHMRRVGHLMYNSYTQHIHLYPTSYTPTHHLYYNCIWTHIQAHQLASELDSGFYIHWRRVGRKDQIKAAQYNHWAAVTLIRCRSVLSSNLYYFPRLGSIAIGSHIYLLLPIGSLCHDQMCFANL